MFRKNAFRKRNITKMLLISLILFISVGYALLYSNINIYGNTAISKSSWSVHWDEDSFAKAANSVDILSGQTTSSGGEQQLVTNTVPVISDTEIQFGAKLEKLGDTAEFTIDVINDGTIDANLRGITMSSLSPQQSKYIEFSVYYGGAMFTSTSTGLRIPLPASGTNTTTVKIKVKYIQPDSATDLPSSNEIINFTVSFNYEQA